MKILYRQGTKEDLPQLKNLAIKSWTTYKSSLTEENWLLLNNAITDNKTFEDLINQSTCFLCTTTTEDIVGMAFIVPSGNPTEIYPTEWCYIRFVSVDPEFGGNGIGKTLTTMCIDYAKLNGEKCVALHTSEIMKTARHIYESLGFTILKEIDKRLGLRYWLYKLDIN